MANLDMLIGRGTLVGRQPYATARRGGYLGFNSAGSGLMSVVSIQLGHGPQPRVIWAGFTDNGDIFFAFVDPAETEIKGYETNWNEEGLLRISLPDLFAAKNWRVLKGTHWSIPLVMENVPGWGELPVLKMKSVTVEAIEERQSNGQKSKPAAGATEPAGTKGAGTEVAGAAAAAVAEAASTGAPGAAAAVAEAANGSGGVNAADKPGDDAKAAVAAAEQGAVAKQVEEN